MSRGPFSAQRARHGRTQIRYEIRRLGELPALVEAG